MLLLLLLLLLLTLTLTLLLLLLLLLLSFIWTEECLRFLEVDKDDMSIASFVFIRLIDCVLCVD